MLCKYRFFSAFLNFFFLDDLSIPNRFPTESSEHCYFTCSLVRWSKNVLHLFYLFIKECFVFGAESD